MFVTVLSRRKISKYVLYSPQNVSTAEIIVLQALHVGYKPKNEKQKHLWSWDCYARNRWTYVGEAMDTRELCSEGNGSWGRNRWETPRTQRTTRMPKKNNSNIYFCYFFVDHRRISSENILKRDVWGSISGADPLRGRESRPTRRKTLIWPWFSTVSQKTLRTTICTYSFLHAVCARKETTLLNVYQPYFFHFTPFFPKADCRGLFSSVFHRNSIIAALKKKKRTIRK